MSGIVSVPPGPSPKARRWGDGVAPRERIGPLTTLPRDPICREGFRLHRQEFRLCLGGLHSYNKVRMTPLQNFLLKSLLDLLVALAWACWNRLRASQEEHRARALEHRRPVVRVEMRLGSMFAAVVAGLVSAAGVEHSVL